MKMLKSKLKGFESSKLSAKALTSVKGGMNKQELAVADGKGGSL